MNEHMLPPYSAAAARYVGEHVLGPLFWSFCEKLYLYQRCYDEQNTTALFLARGGLRLRDLYEIYRGRCGLTPPIPQNNMFISRLAACKGCLLKDFDHIAPIIYREFANVPLVEALRALVPMLRNHEITTIKEQMPKHLRNAEITPLHLAALLLSPSPFGRSMAAYFEEQSSLFEKYIASLSSKKNILIDTGWSGTTQLILARRFTDQKWFGLYAGKWNTRGELLPQFKYTTGLMVDESTMSRSSAGWAIFHYHHILESPLELQIPSTEEYRREEDGSISSWPKPNNVHSAQENGLWEGVVNFFKTVDAPRDLATSTKTKNRALKKLSYSILYPSISDVAALNVPPRSADFGKEDRVPVLLPTDQLPFSQKIYRIRKALWRQGQIRLEFPRLATFFCACYNTARRFSKLRIWGNTLIRHYLMAAYKRRVRS